MLQMEKMMEPKIPAVFLRDHMCRRSKENHLCKGPQNSFAQRQKQYDSRKKSITNKSSKQSIHQCDNGMQKEGTYLVEYVKKTFERR